MKLHGKKRLVWVMLLLSLIFLQKKTVNANDNVRILEHFTSYEDNTVTFYLNLEASGAEAMSVLYGNKEERIRNTTCILSADKMYSLILVDNSQSVMRKNQEKVIGLVKDIVQNGAENEQFLIAEVEETELTYGEVDFSMDKEHWFDVLEHMEIENKDADLFLNLSKAVKVLNGIADSEYKRIIVVSDGIHEEEGSAYYSKGELDADLDKTNYPIYTIGVQMGKDTSNDLQNLFSYARRTGAESMIFASDTEGRQVLELLHHDFSYLKVVTAVEKQPCDGSVRNVQFHINEMILNETVALPVVPENKKKLQEESIEEITTSKMIDPGEVPESVETTELQNETAVVYSGKEWLNRESKMQQKESPVLIGILIMVGFLFVVVFLFLLIILQKRSREMKNNKEAPAQDFTKDIVSPKCNVGLQNVKEKEDRCEKTLVLNDRLEPIDSQDRSRYKIVLQNILEKEKVFSTVFSDKILIGRDAKRAGLVIPDMAVSGIHCEIGIWEDKYYIKDLNSSNGSFVNGYKCDEPTEIQDGYQLRLGRTTFFVFLSEL